MAKKILLIEDVKAVYEMYQFAFEKENFKVEIATNKERAMKAALGLEKAQQPDLILLDLILPSKKEVVSEPEFQGIEILKELRTNEKTKNIPIFILTNFDSDETRKTAKDYNVENYFIKSNYTPKELVTIIKRWFTAKGALDTGI